MDVIEKWLGIILALEHLMESQVYMDSNSGFGVRQRAA